MSYYDTHGKGDLFEDIVLIAYSIIQYYALVDEAPWFFVKLKRPAGGRGHNELQSPDFASLGTVEFDGKIIALLVTNEAKNFGDYPLYEETVQGKILDRFKVWPIGFVTGHYNPGKFEYKIVEAKLWQVTTPYQLLPEHPMEKKKEILQHVLRGIVQPLEVYYGHTMNFLCSDNITVTVLDKYTIEIDENGKLLQKIDLRKLKPQTPINIDGLRPLDSIQWRELKANEGIEFYMPTKWSLQFPNNIRITDSFPSHCHTGFRWREVKS